MQKSREDIKADRRARKATLKRIRASIRNAHPHRRGLEGMTLKQYLLARYECELKEFAERI